MSVHPDSLSDDALLEVLDDRAGPSLPLSEREAEARVQAAVLRALPAGGKPFLRRRSPALLLAAALAVTGVSAAFVLTRSGFTGAATDAAPVPANPRAELAPRSGSQQKLEVAPPVVPEPSPVSDAPDVVSSSGSERGSGARSNPLDLLKAANQLRGQGRWAEAERAYAHIASSYGGTAQSPVAALAAASLRLEHLNDPRGALRLYQAALRAPSLSAEAELGIADCYRALGDRAAEIAALRRLTSAHPEALFHERAQRRLQALEARKP
jgi:tetratricopeptide (TPR) repeat protein